MTGGRLCSRSPGRVVDWFRRMVAISAWALVASSSVETAGAQTPGTGSRVLVMPFETATREPRCYWLGEGSAVILTDSLTALGLPVMRRDERLHSFELLRVPVVSGPQSGHRHPGRPGGGRLAGDRRHVHPFGR